MNVNKNQLKIPMMYHTGATWGFFYFYLLSSLNCFFFLKPIPINTTTPRMERIIPRMLSWPIATPIRKRHITVKNDNVKKYKLVRFNIIDLLYVILTK
jgi:hypothetical protein